MASYIDSGIGTIRYAGNVGGSFLAPTSDSTDANISTDLASICTGTGLLYRNLATNADFALRTQSSNIIRFGAAGDIDDRIRFTIGLTSTAASAIISSRISIFNDSGDTGTAIANGNDYNENPTNQTRKIIAGEQTPSASSNTHRWNVSPVPTIYYAAVTDGSSLGLIQYCIRTEDTGTPIRNPECNFLYAGSVTSPHASLTTTSSRYVIMQSHCNSYQYTGSTMKIQLMYANRGAFAMEGFTQLNNEPYTLPLVCTGGSPTPTKQWAVPFPIVSGGVVMGYARNLLMGIGSFPMFVPVRITGSGGNETWMCVCHYGVWGNELLKILMRCYSTSV